MDTRIMFATLGGGVEVVPVVGLVAVNVSDHWSNVRLEFIPREPGEPMWLHRGEVGQLRNYLNAMLAEWPTEADVAAFLEAPETEKVWQPDSADLRSQQGRDTSAADSRSLPVSAGSSDALAAIHALLMGRFIGAQGSGLWDAVYAHVAHVPASSSLIGSVSEETSEARQKFARELIEGAQSDSEVADRVFAMADPNAASRPSFVFSGISSANTNSVSTSSSLGVSGSPTEEPKKCRYPDCDPDECARGCWMSLRAASGSQDSGERSEDAKQIARMAKLRGLAIHWRARDTQNVQESRLTFEDAGLLLDLIARYDSGERATHSVSGSEDTRSKPVSVEMFYEAIRQRDAWAAFAEHAESCGDCYLTGHEHCPEGTRLYADTAPRSSTAQTPREET